MKFDWELYDLSSNDDWTAALGWLAQLAYLIALISRSNDSKFYEPASISFMMQGKI